MPPKTHFQKLTLLNATKKVKNDYIYTQKMTPQQINDDTHP